MEKKSEICTRCEDYCMCKMKETGGLVDQRKTDRYEDIDTAGKDGIYQKLLEHLTCLYKWIFNFNRIDSLIRVQIFRIQNITFGFLSRRNDELIPVGQFVFIGNVYRLYD